MTKLAPVLLFLIAVTSASAQSTSEPWARIGLFGGVNVSIHSAAFGELPGVPNCCPVFESGTGAGGVIGLLFEQILNERLELALRASYQGRSARLEASELVPVVVSGRRVDAELRHVLEGSLAHLQFEPMIVVRLGTVGLHLGPSIGIPVTTTFAQREELAKPEVGTFENNRRVRNDTSGAIPNAASLDAGITLGASVDLPLNAERTLVASPELFYTADLTDVTTDRSWRSHALRFGVALKYTLLRDAAPVVAVPVTPPPTTQSAAPVVSITALAVAPDGSERTDVTMHIEEFISTNMRPLLNYVFFDDGSAELPERYVRVDASTFDAQRLHSLDAIETYHHVLNIVGERLRSRPGATARIVGCNTAWGAETGARALSAARARAVRGYLASVWGIDSARLRIEARDLPALPSDTATDDGRAENRRAEIIVDDPAVLAPVVTVDTLRTVTPPLIRFRTSVQPDTAIERWEIAATQRGLDVKGFQGEGTPPASIDWETNESQLAIPSAGDSLRYALRVVERGRPIVDEGSLPVNLITLRRKREERVGDRVIDRYSLILFEYDRAELDALNAGIARDVRARITPTATVTITGHTDRIGEDAYNQRLSEERARNVARALGVAPERARGLGESSLLFSNHLPEGRFYSRTVSIVVETPVGSDE